MGVYIKDMEMPKSCSECPLMEYNEETGCYCYLTNQYASRTRPDGCPLVEVPPHGRLGDLDELYIHLNEWYLMNNPVFTKEEALYIHTMLLGIVEAPTIIPAKEDE